ncbi:MAG: pentapeptide repeat-containing protein [Paenibacillus sp.]|uniref:pentapeptide repeat-containing protein n=1 Tax=Paenibacillus sp. TaxID=58172 RepID=UPI0025D732D1|nr:pentapeptide repeat-containing protein [Paenibacillus sp.]MBR2564930.1 pentapeptide repeat-containing protein [Paenibacillus sp.]
MHQMELWQQFLEQEVLPLRNSKIQELNAYYIRHRQEIVQGIVSLFDAFCEQVRLQQELGDLQACSTIHVSLMRTRLNQGDPVYMIHASDLHREGEVSARGIIYDASWIYRYMEQWFEECENSRKRYMNRIDQAALHAWQAGQLYPFHIYMVHAVRLAMDDIRKLDSFQNVDKYIEFEVRVGEYQDHEVTESVYRMSGKQRSSITCRGWLESKLPSEYIYEHIKGVDLSQGEYEELDFNYARFEEVKLSRSHMAETSLLGTRFMGCKCDHVNFAKTLLYDADFRECDLRAARFDGALGGRNTFAETYSLFYGMNGVQFQGANLSHASFRYAKIAGDFIGAHLDNVDFTGADLAGSRMLKQDRFRVQLTAEQRTAIEWVGTD